MNKYRDKSDFEINKAVFVAAKINHDDTDLSGSKVFYGNGAKWIEFDPCNDPADAMPIIFDNNISLIFSHKEYPLATNNPSGLFRDALSPKNVVTNKNPLRAAMELFLMMKDAENES